jgi:hypothetical protein
MAAELGCLLLEHEEALHAARHDCGDMRPLFFGTLMIAFHFCG